MCHVCIMSSVHRVLKCYGNISVCLNGGGVCSDASAYSLRKKCRAQPLGPRCPSFRQRSLASGVLFLTSVL